VDLSYSFGNMAYYRNDYDNDGYPTYGGDFGADVDDITRTLYVPNADFKNKTAAMFQLYENVSLLTFSEVIETSSSVGNIRLAAYNPNYFGTGSVKTVNSNEYGGITTYSTNSSYANFPWSDTYNTGDIFFNSNSFLDGDLLDNNPYFADTILHEIGHVIGLSHPHDTIGSYSSDTANVTKSDTVMAYAAYDGSDVPSSVDTTYSQPTTLMVADVEAIQFLYGVNEQYNSGDTTYQLSTFSNYNWIYATIWDAGGNDTFSWADQSTIAAIDLRDGNYSFFGKISSQSDSDLSSVFGAGDGLLGIAKNAIIENAIGGSNSDTIVGNDYANYLYGGAGAGVKDTLTGNGGADIFISCIADATTDLSLADSITDFLNGTDKIGLEDRSFSDLNFSNENGGTKIVDTSSSKILFWLDSVDYTLIDSDDFISTDFI